MRNNSMERILLVFGFLFHKKHDVVDDDDAASVARESEFEMRKNTKECWGVSQIYGDKT